MAAPKFNKREREELVMDIARLRARGRRPGEIAREKGISVTQVYNYINKLDADYPAHRTEREVAAHREVVAEELRQIQDEALKAWDASKKRVEFDADLNRIEIEDPGDPRFLGVAVQCIADRRKLFALDVPVVKQVEHTGQFDFRAFFAAVPDEVPDEVAGKIFGPLPALPVVTSNDPVESPASSHPPENGHARRNGRNGTH